MYELQAKNGLFGEISIPSNYWGVLSNYQGEPENFVDKLPPVISKIIHRALAKNLEKRNQTCGEMLADVEKAIRKLSLRPTMWGLARFMKDLFKKSIPLEEQAMMLMLAIILLV